ncbi:MAG: hypothetical protein GY811_21885 [Myxococcales bacterium]|nr:hypothetical protein [Myxococcales bacterium]
MTDSVSKGTELQVLPKELRIEKRASNAIRAGAIAWLPLVILAPVALMVEVVPAAIGILLITGLTMREFRRSRSDLLPNLELADSGDIEEATHRVAMMAKRERNWRRKAFLVGVLSNLELRAGNRDSAEAMAREALRHRQRKQPALERSLRANLAMIVALGGNFDEALELLPQGAAPDAITDTSRLVVWARCGRWQEIADYKYRRLPQMQGMRHSNRVMALCKAIALNATGGGALKLQRYLDEARPRLAEEFDYLSKDWPELVAFIEEHPDLHHRRSILERA